MKKRLILVLLLIFLHQGCATEGENDDLTIKRLNKRVEEAYQYYKERNFESFLGMFESSFYEDRGKQKEIDVFKNELPPLDKYEIKEITINGTNAIVCVNNTMKFEDEGRKAILVTEMICDHWVMEEGEWYIREFGRGKAAILEEIKRERELEDIQNKLCQGKKGDYPCD